MDFQKNLKDGKLDLEYTELNSEDIVELGQFIKGNRNITALKLRECSIDFTKIKLLVEPINNSSIVTFDISSNNLAGAEVPREIAKMTKLTHLIISSNKLGVEGAAEIAKMDNLTSLDIILNQLGDEGATQIAKMSNLTKLSIGGNGIGDKGVVNMALPRSS